MATEFKLYGVVEDELYANKTKEEKQELQKKMVKMAKGRGIKPTARYFKTYPSTVRRYLKKFEQQEGNE